MVGTIVSAQEAFVPLGHPPQAHSHILAVREAAGTSSNKLNSPAHIQLCPHLRSLQRGRGGFSRELRNRVKCAYYLVKSPFLKM